MADSSPAASRSPGDPPYRSICCSWISRTSSSERNTGSMDLSGEFLEGFAVAFVGPFLSSVELFPAGRRLSRGDDQLFAVGADFEWSLGIDLEEVEDGAIDHQCQAVSVFGELLNHMRPYFQCITKSN
jgi:hypothetical protein